MEKPKILYLHGLDGSLSSEKRVVLEKYFDVTAPQIEYRENYNVFDDLNGSLRAKGEYKAIIGNSMGGCFAYYLSLYNSLPALLFNPALIFRSIDVNLPTIIDNNNPITFIIGGQDVVVSAKENTDWIVSKNNNANFMLKWYNQMEHRVDIETFETEVDLFSESIL